MASVLDDDCEGVPVRDSLLPAAQCVATVPGPGDATLLHGRLWSNMLVFWLQKFVSIDSNGQSRVYNISSGGTGARNIWEKHKASWLDY